MPPPQRQVGIEHRYPYLNQYLADIATVDVLPQGVPILSGRPCIALALRCILSRLR